MFCSQSFGAELNFLNHTGGCAFVALFLDSLVRGVFVFLWGFCCCCCLRTCNYLTFSSFLFRRTWKQIYFILRCLCSYHTSFPLCICMCFVKVLESRAMRLHFAFSAYACCRSTGKCGPLAGCALGHKYNWHSANWALSNTEILNTETLNFCQFFTGHV